MFSKEEAKNFRIEFWTAFGVYMRQHTPLLSAKQKWVNYKTGVRGIFFRMDAGKRSASVAIEIQNNDSGINALFFEQFEELKNYLEAESGMEWLWEKEVLNPQGRPIARISQTRDGLSLYNKQDWGALFAFFEACIVPLDSVWSDCNEVFKDLAG